MQFLALKKSTNSGFNKKKEAESRWLRVNLVTQRYNSPKFS